MKAVLDLRDAVMTVLKEDATLRTKYRVQAGHVIARQPTETGLGQRNLGNAPLLEVSIDAYRREPLCDYLDKAFAQVSIRITIQSRQMDILELSSAIVEALKRKPEFGRTNVVMNDWTHDFSVEDNDTYIIGELTLTVGLTVPEGEE